MIQFGVMSHTYVLTSEHGIPVFIYWSTGKQLIEFVLPLESNNKSQDDEEHCWLEKLSCINKLNVLFKIKDLSKKELQHNEQISRLIIF